MEEICVKAHNLATPRESGNCPFKGEPLSHSGRVKASSVVHTHQNVNAGVCDEKSISPR